MNLQGNDPLREMLAAEYALGTLRGGARRRFERLARHDAGLRQLALEWSERLVPLLEDIPSAVPSRRVWEAIEARLPGFSARHGNATSQGSGWWDRLGFWRGLSAAFATVAVIALGLAIRPTPAPEVRIVQSEPEVIRPAPQVIRPAPKVVEVDRLPTAVATLTDAKSGKPVAIVFTRGERGPLMVRVMPDVAVDDGKALQLWMAPDNADGLVSLGIVPATAHTELAPIDGADVAMLAHAKAFGLSLEPAGGSAQPTKVLGLGAVVRLSG